MRMGKEGARGKRGKARGKDLPDDEDDGKLVIVEPDGLEHDADDQHPPKVHTGTALTPTTTTRTGRYVRPRSWKPTVAGLLIMFGAVFVILSGTLQLTMQGEDPFTIEDKGAVVGTIKDPDGSGVAGAVIKVRGTDMTRRTGDGGGYKITNVPDGPVVLEVHAYGYRSASVPTYVMAGIGADQAPRLNVTLKRVSDVQGVDRTDSPVNVTGRVVDPNTNPIAGANVTMLDEGTVLTSADGSFEFTGIAPGKAVISFQAAGHSLVERTFFVQEGDDQIIIVLEPVAGVISTDDTDGPATLTVRLLGPSGAPVRDGTVMIGPVHVLTDDAGTAVFTLSPGNTTIRAAAFGQGSSFFTFYLHEGAGTMDLSLPGESVDGQKGDRDDVLERLLICNSVSILAAVLVALSGVMCLVRRSYWVGIGGALVLTILMYRTFGVGMFIGVVAFVLLILSRREYE